MNVSPSTLADSALADAVTDRASVAADSATSVIDSLSDVLGDIATEAVETVTDATDSVLDTVGDGAHDLVAAGGSLLGRSSPSPFAVAPVWLARVVWRHKRLVGSIGLLAILAYVTYRYWQEREGSSRTIGSIPSSHDRQPA